MFASNSAKTDLTVAHCAMAGASRESSHFKSERFGTIFQIARATIEDVLAPWTAPKAAGAHFL